MLVKEKMPPAVMIRSYGAAAVRVCLGKKGIAETF